MKKITTLFLLLSFCAQAQKMSVTKGSEIMTSRGGMSDFALDHDSSGFYFVRSKGGYFSNKFIIQKIDPKKSTPVFEKLIDLTGDAYIGGAGSLLGAYNKNGKILVFSHAVKGKENHLILQKFSSFTGEELTKPVIIDDLKDTQAYIISDALLDFKIQFSPDDKRMLVVSELKKDEKVQKVKAKLFDATSFEKIWEKEPIGIYGNSTVSSFNYCIDNEGTFSYLFSYLRNDAKKSFMNGSTLFTYENQVHGIGIIRANSTENKVIAIPSTGITTFEPKLEVANDKLICTGQYFEGEHVYRFDGDISNTGFFLLTIDPVKAELKTKSFAPLTEDIRSKLAYKDMGKKFSEAGNKVYMNFETVLNNNCFYQIIERSVGKDAMNGMGKELIIYKYDQNHQLQWMKLLQRSTMGEWNGMNYLITKKVNLFYYDSAENLVTYPEAGVFDPKEYKTTKMSQRAVLICASIDDKGTITRQQISTNGERMIMDEKNYEPNRIVKSDALLIPVYMTGSKLRYDIVALED